MTFTKEICPACKKPTTQVFDTDNYICKDSKHYYIIDQVSINGFRLLFKNFSICDWLNVENTYLRDQYGDCINKKQIIKLQTILDLSSVDDIINYFQNIEIMS